MRASIAVSHHQLRAEPSGEDAAWALPFLGLLDLPALTLPVAAELTGWPQDRTEAALDRLIDSRLHARDHLRRTGLPETTLGLHGNLVSCYRQLGRHDEALASLEEGLELVKGQGMLAHEARYLAMRGQIHFDLERFEESVVALEASLARWAEVDSPYGAAIATMNLADAHLELRQYDQAHAAYRRGHDLSKIAGLRHGEIAGLWGMGRTSRQLGDLEVSMEYLRQSLLLMRELGLITQEDADQRLASLHDEQSVPDVFMS
ncbi:tetratricopeptide repeat protein [Nonomuraea sp. NBC_01738]|uniref:tetratricopeptide repeat protein n=1 Tax=Nonomuraea sp. NBC_01738 TaxID=2976003 RepID=UPI002E0FFD78|nr:tetratricopeptide repeat protein [Nonomuraea sp. NBC_01738]